MVEDAGNSCKGASDEYLQTTPGVSDSIEQHSVNKSKPGGQPILGARLKQHRVCLSTVKGRTANERLVWDGCRYSWEAR